MEFELVELVQSYKDNVIDIARTIGGAKEKNKRKEYKELVESSGLSKDQISLSLKRFALIQEGFDTDLLSDYSDRMIKKVTNKSVNTNEELVSARKKLGKGLLSYEEFCELIDKNKVVKTDDEKGISKAESLMKFIDKANIGAEAMMQMSEIIKPLANYTEENEEDV